MTARRVLAAAAFLTTLLAPAPSHAGTAHTEARCGESVKEPPQPCFTTAYFTGSPGEENLVQFATGDFGVRFIDAGHPIEARQPCRNVDPNTVECPAEGMEVRAGDAADQVFAELRTGPLAPRQPVRAYGQEGDDMLGGTQLADVLSGGPGEDELRSGFDDDALYGGPGIDLMDGGRGNDSLFLADATGGIAGAPAPEGLLDPRTATPAVPDFADGGDGTDTALYTGEDRPVEIDLLARTSSGAAAGDAFTAVENLAGGTAADRLAGDEGPNRLTGGDGGLRLTGRGGGDTLVGGRGSDTLDGGPGDDDIVGTGVQRDLLYGRDGDDVIGTSAGGLLDGGDGDDVTYFALVRPVTDLLTVDCGLGEDVGATAPRVRVLSGCEHATFADRPGGMRVRRALVVWGRRATTLVRAPAGERGRLVLRDRRTGRRLGAARWRGTGANARLSFRLPVSAARRAHRIAVVDATLEEAGRDPLRAPVTLVG